MMHLVFLHAMAEEGEPTYLGLWKIFALVTIVALIFAILRSESFDLSSIVLPVVGVAIALIFLEHAYIAFHNPSEFLEPLEHNHWVQSTHISPDRYLLIIKISDFSMVLLFLMTFFPSYARTLGPSFVAAYAACWILMAAYMSGQFIEHLAYLVVIVAYACLARNTCNDDAAY